MAEDSSEKAELTTETATEVLTEAPAEVKFSSRLNWKTAVPATIAAFILLVILLLPLAIEYSAEKWLQEHGVPQAEIENVDLNLFSGEFVLQELKAGDGLNIKRLAVNIDWLPLFKQVVHVRALELDSANLNLHQDAQQQWQLGDIKLEPAVEPEKGEAVAAEPQGKPWLAVVDDLRIKGLLVDVKGQEVQLKLPVDSLQLNLSNLTGSEQALEAALKVGETSFSGFGYRVHNNALDLTGKVLFSMAAEDIAASLKSEDAVVKLTGLKLARQDGEALAAVESLAVNKLQMAGINSHKLESINISNLTMQPQLTGAGSLNLESIDVQKIDADLKGQIKVAALILKVLEADGMGGGDDRMRLKRLELTNLKMEPGKTVNLQSLTMQGFDLKQQQGKQLLAAIEGVSLNNFAMTSAEQGSFDSLTLNRVKLPASGKKSMGSIGAIVASSATLDTNGIYHLKKLQFNDLDTTLIKQKSGKFVVLDELESKPKAEAGKQNKKEPVKKAAMSEEVKEPVVIIDELIVSSGSKIAYRDESLSPPLDTTMSVKKFRFAPLDLSGKGDGSLDMQMGIGKYGEVSAKGTLRPHSEKLKTDLVVSVKNFEMPGLSGFIEPEFGKSIQTGQFNLDADINIKDNKISAKNKLLIRKLELGKSDQPGRAEQSIGMPVGMALDMLRNDRGDIEIEVPISGNLDDPNINLNAIINKALISSLSAGAMTYATLALQPYGSIILAADLASDLIKRAAKPKLTPIRFAEFELSLNPEMTDYISKIAGLLKKSEQFRVQICGVATRIEGEPVAQPPATDAAVKVEPAVARSDGELLLLAERRADVVMDALKAHGITTERLFGCRAKIDDARLKSLPRVDLILD